ncbi:hypothetical protein [Nocardioides sp. TF02-7]|uniref:hypothetical protein n=1 Tax=Nocardioides sp. TF02-7 TaxID=2917724 RepID=UPI001F05BCBD|nr:hypothetical protein [Nocardioides sp. TF02-7]UMG94596.1 hypothetical protein MF408_11960 [Nocardioides sp. TF02-7]
MSVVDTATGEEVWADDLRDPGDTYPGGNGLSIAVTERTVTVAGRCGLERWSLTDGGAARPPDRPR